MFHNQSLWKMYIAFFAKNEDVVFMYNEYILETPLIHICFTLHPSIKDWRQLVIDV